MVQWALLPYGRFPSSCQTSVGPFFDFVNSRHFQQVFWKIKINNQLLLGIWKKIQNKRIGILEGKKKIRIKDLSVLAIYPKPLKKGLGFMKEPAKNP